MKQPILKDDAFLADVRSCTLKDGLRIWWLGQSGFLVQWQGRHVLLDPYLSDSLTEKYASTDKPHVRMTARVVDPTRLGFVDLVTSSHSHTDHLDAASLVPLLCASPGAKIVCPESIRATVAQRCQLDLQSPRIHGLDVGGVAALAGVSIHAVPAAHEAIDRDAQGRCLYLGYVIKLGPHTIYHSGDTIRYDGQAQLLRPYNVDVALLPINGAHPERRVAGNLDGPQAAQLAMDMGAKVVIPCHYDMFEFNTATPDAFVERCKELGQRYVVLQNGGRFDLTEP